MVTFGLNLRSLRINAGLTQKQLADRLGSDIAYIGQLERGKKSPGFAYIGRLAHALGVSADALFVQTESDADLSPRVASALGKLEARGEKGLAEKFLELLEELAKR